MDAESTALVPPPGCPAHGTGARVPLYGPEFAADPHAYYDYMRQFGATTAVELAPGVDATLITDYGTALQMLQDPSSFRKDARRWRALKEGRVPADSPVLPLLAYRPNCLFSDGVEHLRLRQAVTDSLAKIDSRRVAQRTQQISDYLIAQFSSRGSADLIGEYTKQLPLFVFTELFGCPADIGDRVLFGISGMFDGVNAGKAVEVLFQASADLVALKRVKPGDDVASWLMKHEVGLSDEELVYELGVMLGAGSEPLRNLIGNTMHRLLTHDQYAHKGGLISEALDDTLWGNPPLTNFLPHYAATDMEFAGTKLQSGDLVLVSIAAANNDRTLAAARQSGSNRAHLSFSAGPHACPSKETARHITVTAIENLLNRLPDIELAVPADSLSWRPGPFSRSLTALPTRFTAVQPVHRAPASQPRQEAPAREEVPTSTRKAERGGLWSSFLSWLAK
ncbi:cytochrome P450 [Kitasatospora sp. NPDC101183]|uniref:cytochrome P450 n=1 Tax=Kitasatospora sp. NPDC101183 TaxID=3364100 RepID=UPI0037FF2BC5